MTDEEFANEIYEVPPGHCVFTFMMPNGKRIVPLLIIYDNGLLKVPELPSGCMIFADNILIHTKP